MAKSLLKRLQEQGNTKALNAINETNQKISENRSKKTSTTSASTTNTTTSTNDTSSSTLSFTDILDKAKSILNSTTGKIAITGIKSQNPIIGNLVDTINNISNNVSEGKNVSIMEQLNQWNKATNNYGKIDKYGNIESPTSVKEQIKGIENSSNSFSVNTIKKDENEDEIEKKNTILNVLGNNEETNTRKVSVLDDYFTKKHQALLEEEKEETETETESNEEEETSVLDKLADLAKNMVKMPEAFEDGYNFGDIYKTIESTKNTAMSSVLSGGLGVAEGVERLGYTVASDVNKADKNSLREDFNHKTKIEGKSVDEAVEEVYGNSSDSKDIPTGLIGFLKESIDNAQEEYWEADSVLGETSKNILEGVGYSGVLGISEAVGGPVLMNILTFASSMGNSLDELQGEEGLTIGEKYVKAIASGSIETLTENLFGLFGKTGVDEALANKLASQISSSIEKILVRQGVSMASEGAEELISYTLNFAFDRLFDAYTYKDFSEDWNWDEVVESAFTASVSAGLSGAGKTVSEISNISSKNNVSVSEATELYANALDESGKSIVADEITNADIIAKTISDSNLSETDKKTLQEFAEENNLTNDEVQKLIDNHKTEETNTNLDKKAIKEIAQKFGKTEQEIINDFNIRNSQKQGTTINNETSNNNNQQVIQNGNNIAQNQFSSEIEENTKYEGYNQSEKLENYVKSAEEHGIDIQNDVTKSIFNILDNRDIGVTYNTEIFEGTDGDALYNTTTDKDGNVTREVIINPSNQEKALQNVIVHELTHDLENSKEYKAISKAVQEKMRQDEGYEAGRKDLEEMYRQVYKNKTEQQFQELIDQEEVADYLGKNLGNQEFVNELIESQERSTIDKIINWVKNRIDSLKNIKNGNKEAEYWRKVKRNFEKAYNKKYKPGKENTITKYSTKNVEKTDKKEYNNVNENEKNAYKTSPINKLDEYHLERENLPYSDVELNDLQDIQEKIKSKVQSLKDEGYKLSYDKSNSSTDITFVDVSNEKTGEYIDTIRIANHFKVDVSEDFTYDIDMSEYTSKTALINDVEEAIKEIRKFNDEIIYDENGFKLPNKEYIKVESAINTDNNNLSNRIAYKFYGNHMYVFSKEGFDEYIFQARIKIESNKDLIDIVRKDIDYGTIESSENFIRDIERYATERQGYNGGRYNRNNANSEDNGTDRRTFRLHQREGRETSTNNRQPNKESIANSKNSKIENSKQSSFSMPKEIQDIIFNDEFYEQFENVDKTKITETIEELKEYKETLDTNTDEGLDNYIEANNKIRALQKGYDNIYDLLVGEEQRRQDETYKYTPELINKKVEEYNKQQEKQAKLQKEIEEADPHKKAQYEILQETNPMFDDEHVGIRSPADIKTFEEAINDKESFTWGDYSKEDALRDLKRNKVRIYSSYAIKNGVFVSTSYKQALEYAGMDSSKVHSKVVNPNRVAWINGDEGQYASVTTNPTTDEDIRYSMNNKNAWEEFLDKYSINTGTTNTINDIKLPIAKSNENDYEIFNRAKGNISRDIVVNIANDLDIQIKNGATKFVSTELKNKSGHNKTPSIISVKELFKNVTDNNAKDFRKEALDNALELFRDKEVRIIDTQTDVEIKKEALKKTFSGKVTETKIQTANNIGEILEQGIYMYSTQNTNEKDGIIYHHYFTPITYNNENGLIRSVIKEYTQNKTMKDRFYYHQLEYINKEDFNSVLPRKNGSRNGELKSSSVDTVDDVSTSNIIIPQNVDNNQEITTSKIDFKDNEKIYNLIEESPLSEENKSILSDLVNEYSLSQKDTNTILENVENNQDNVEQTIEESKEKIINNTAKSQKYENRQHTKFKRQMSAFLGVSQFSQNNKEIFNEALNRLKDDYQNNGKISQETKDTVFKDMYDNLVKEDNEYYNNYKYLKDEIRRKTLKITDDLKSNMIDDWVEFKKNNTGTLNMSNHDGVAIDVYYAELSNEYPDMFPDTITDPVSQIKRVSEVAKSISKSEMNVRAYADEYLSKEYETWAKNEFEKQVSTLQNSYKTIEKYNQDRMKKNTKEDYTKPNVEEIISLYNHKKEFQREYEKINNKELLTERENGIVDRLLKNEMGIEEILPGFNKEGIVKVYNAKQRINFVNEELARYKQEIKEERKEQIENLVENCKNWKDKKLGFEYSRETAQRNVKDIMSKKDAQRINDTIMEPISEHTAEQIRFIQKYNDKIDDLNLDKKLKYNWKDEITGKNIKIDEATLASQYVEGKITDSQVSSIADLDRIKEIAKTYKNMFNEIFDMMNEKYVSNGYSPIERRQNYFPHFIENQPDSLLGKIASKFGINVQYEELPTDIAGRTETFKPGVTFNKNKLSRKTDKTSLNALKAIDMYLQGASDVIYHTDDIQNLRTLSTVIRDKYKDEVTTERILEIQENPELTQEEREYKIKEIIDAQQTPLNNFVTWVDEYANVIANKKSSADRQLEKELNRKMYANAKNLQGRIASNLVGGNISVALTNFGAIAQAFDSTKASNIVIGMVQTAENSLKESFGKEGDDFAYRSNFLTSRRGTDVLRQKSLSEMLSDKLGFVMNVIDDFSSESIVRAKYRENIKQGMEQDEALKNADRYARDLMANRSKGDQPVVFYKQNVVSKIMNSFQIEPNNMLSHYIKDLGEQSTKNIVVSYAKATIFNFAFNSLLMAIRGGDPILPDLIRVAEDIVDYGLQGGDDDDDDKEDLGDLAVNLAEDVLGWLPWGSIVSSVAVASGIDELEDSGKLMISGAIPDFTKISTLLDKEVSSDYKKQVFVNEILLKPFAYLGLPTGGAQLSKTVKGLSSYIEGGSYTYNKEGEETLQFPVEQNAGNLIKSLLFGKYSTSEGQDYLEDFDSLSVKETALYKSIKSDNLDYDDIKAYFDYSSGKSKEQKIYYISQNMNLSTDQKWEIYKYNILSSNEGNDGNSQVTNAEYMIEEGITTKKDYLEIYENATKNDVSIPNRETIDTLVQSGLSYSKYMEYQTEVKSLSKEKEEKELTSLPSASVSLDNYIGDTDESESTSVTKADKLSILSNGNYTDEEKELIYANYISSDDTTYSTLKQLGDFDINEYFTYKTNNFSSDNSSTKKEKFITYLNNSSFTDIEKLYLLGKEYKLSSSQQNTIQEYVSNLNLTTEEKKELLLTLSSSNIVEMSDGSLSWKR